MDTALAALSLWGSPLLPWVAACAAIAVATCLAVAVCGRALKPSAVALHHSLDGFAGARSARLLERTQSLREYPASPVVALLGGVGSSVLLNGCRRPRPLRWTHAQDVRLPDGGMLRLQWLLHDPAATATPPGGTLVVIPGTRGTADSPYVVAMARAAFARGWDVVAAPLRGCGVGGALATPHCLDGVHWTDLVHVLRAVHDALPPARDDPRRRLCAVGYSMGGGMLAHYVSELGPGCPLEAAVAVSATADYTAIEAHSKAGARARTGPFSPTLAPAQCARPSWAG